MCLKGRFRILVGLGVAAVLVWGCYRGYRARLNLVTLNVRNMDVRKVVSKIQWQTWERVIVHKDIAGPVTIEVKNVPIDDVLNIIGLQVHARWTALYPIYARGAALVPLKKAVRGDITISGSGWTNLFTAPSWRRVGTGGFASNTRLGNKLVSAQIDSKDLAFVALALSRFTQAQVVPEDGAEGTIRLRLHDTPFEEAVARVAAQAHRKWDGFYTLQPLGGFYAPASQRAAASARAETNLNVVTAPPQSQLTASERAAVRQREFEATLVTMSPAEREKAQQQWDVMEELRALPPEERQRRLQEMSAHAAPATQQDLQQRMQNRLRNSTPDQRVERDRIRLERQKRQQQQTTP
ncbi:MAG TPA: hypothetical protein VK530_14010 [Candidatus Acidoferrum sp.]|nr:hypothetical protein [Candidatus Acidoferrum sp.]